MVYQRFNGAAGLNLPIVVAALAFGFGSISCQSFYRYSVFDLADGQPESDVHFSSSQYCAQESEDAGNAIIDSGGTLWSLDVYYDQKLVSPADVKLIVDSVRISYPALSVYRTLSRPSWRREAAYYMPYTIIRIGPISVPAHYRSEIEVNLRLSAYNTCTDTLLFTRHYQLLMKR